MLRPIIDTLNFLKLASLHKAFRNPWILPFGILAVILLLVAVFSDRDFYHYFYSMLNVVRVLFRLSPGGS